MFGRHRHAYLRVLPWLLGVLLPGAWRAEASPVVERVSFTARDGGEGYVVRIHASEKLIAYSEPRFVGSHRLQLILFNATLAPACQQDAPAGPIRGYSVQPRAGHLYFEFQLDEGVALQAASYRDRASNDLIVGLTFARQATPERAVTALPRAERVPREPVEPAGAGMVDARARWKLDTIVIDAGHGGHDTGAIGAGGIREKDIVLPVARKVGRYLEELLGVRVVYTRDDDRFITLANRGRIANREGGKLFISIHANAATNRRAAGTETYFLGVHKSEAARSVMERENSVIRLENNPDDYDGLDQQALIVQTLAASAYMRKSEQLAGFVQAQFTDRVGRTNRGVKQAGFYVLWRASMPAILVELGFVTNPEEAAFLAGEAGQDYLASAIFRAVRDYKAQYEKGLELVIQP